jgi:hypothetical protein
LDYGRQGLLRHAARLQEAGEVGSLAQLGDAQFHGPGPCLPVPLAVAIALGQPECALLAVGRPGQRSHLQLHQPLRGKRDHVAKDICVGGLLHQRAKVHHVIGHWSSSGCLVVANPSFTRRSINGHRHHPGCYSAVEGAQPG